jgi:glycosyltransferase involved in cell wall biosynthesis
MSVKRKNILIFTSSHLCRNPRVYKEACALGNAGYDVTVLTMATHRRFSAQDQTLLAGAPFKLKLIDYTAQNQSVQLSYFFQRCCVRLAKALLKRIKIETPYCLGPAQPLVNAALAETGADLTILHTEIPIWAAKSLVRRGRKIAVDLEDWYSEDLLYADRTTRPIKLLHASETFALHHAVYTSTTSRSMAAAVADNYGCPSLAVIRNVFPLETQFRQQEPLKSAVPSFIWFSQTIGPGRGLELFLSAWCQMKYESNISLLGDLRPGYDITLRERLTEQQNTRLKFIPLVSPTVLPKVLRSHDIGLALEPKWPRNKDLTISNKIFQYLNSGLAVVATDTAGQSEVFQGVGNIGLLVEAHETSLLAKALDSLVTNRDRLNDMQRAARDAACSVYCWEKERLVLLDLVERVFTTAI